jgi:hypothetical protein
MVRYTLVPRARGWEFLDRVHRTVPDSPDEIEDCCGHLQEQTAIESREHAREWLVFLQALGCVDESTDGYYRTAKPDSPEGVADSFENSLFGVEELLAVLSNAAELLTVDELSKRIDESERDRLQSAAGTPESARESVERRLQWAELFGLVSRQDDRYYSTGSR